MIDTFSDTRAVQGFEDGIRKVLEDPSVHNGLTNQQRWGLITGTFSCDEDGLFSEFPYRALYETKNPLLTFPASCVTDLRIQALDLALDKNSDSDILHREWVRNTLWRGRFLEIVDLQDIVVGTDKDRPN